MISFRTIVNPGVFSRKMGISDKFVTIGSCFADVIGNQLKDFKIGVKPNPFGVLYNPVSIHQALTYAIHEQLPAADRYLQADEIFLNYDFHSAVAATSLPTLTTTIQDIIGETHRALVHAQWLIVTYGSAWVYTRKETGDIVANCHKVAAKSFAKSLLSDQQIESSFDALYASLKKINPDLQIILTISPVRHVKDTLELNSVSKSVLRTACYNLTTRYKDVTYFPAFEIMMDDLRDYRFYKADMIHPNEVAEAYIWSRFAEANFDEPLNEFIKSWADISRAMAHKPFHPATGAHRLFLKETLKKVEQMASMVNVDHEIALINEQLQATSSLGERS